MEKKEIENILSEMKLSMESQFVPWSLSRNSKDKYPSLNWKVTIKKNEREILTTDYMAGSGHCPAYNRAYNKFQSLEKSQLILHECENGFQAKMLNSISYIQSNKKSPILPDFVDVMYSLSMDSDAIEYDFEDWCNNFGYEGDSRKAEKIYNECKDIGLKLIRVLGTDGLKKLREEVYQDY